MLTKLTSSELTHWKLSQLQPCTYDDSLIIMYIYTRIYIHAYIHTYIQMYTCIYMLFTCDRVHLVLKGKKEKQLDLKRYTNMSIIKFVALQTFCILI